MIKNRQKNIYKACIIFTILFIATAVFFFYGYSDFRNIAGPMILVSATLGLTSFVMIFIFKKRSDALEDAIANKKVIAQWKYSKEEWDKYSKDEYELRKAEKLSISFILSGITFLVFGIFILIIDEAKLEMAGVMLGLILFFFGLGYASPRIGNYFRRRKKDPQIVIMERGILDNSTYHTWDFPLSRLEKVAIRKTPFYHISVTYGFFDRLGPRSYTLNLPVPRNSEKEAKKVSEILKKVNKIR